VEEFARSGMQETLAAVVEGVTAVLLGLAMRRAEPASEASVMGRLLASADAPRCGSYFGLAAFLAIVGGGCGPALEPDTRPVGAERLVLSSHIKVREEPCAPAVAAGHTKQAEILRGAFVAQLKRSVRAAVRRQRSAPVAGGDLLVRVDQLKIARSGATHEYSVAVTCGYSWVEKSRRRSVERRFTETIRWPVAGFDSESRGPVCVFGALHAVLIARILDGLVEASVSDALLRLGPRRPSEGVCDDTGGSSAAKLL